MASTSDTPHLRAVPNGSWEGKEKDGPRYDVHKVYAKGGRGETRMANARIPDAYHRFIEEFVGMRRHADVKTATDFIRDALHHRIEYWKSQMPELEAIGVDTNTILDEAEALAAEIELANRVGPTWVKVLGDAVRTNDRATVLRTVAKASSALNVMPRPARTMVSDAIEQARQWLKATSSVKVIGSEGNTAK